MQTNPTHTSLVAIGDSFTEGMSDLLPDGTYRGWADLLAGRMAARRGDPLGPELVEVGPACRRKFRLRLF
ncbi:hypothetical protein AB0I50_38390, partial [Streptomyces prunicolor]